MNKKILYFHLIIILIFCSKKCYSQNESLIIEKNNGIILTYSINEVENICIDGPTTGVKDQSIIETVLSRFTLYQNYPNPFNPSTTIQYEIPQLGEVSIDIYDIQGRNIRSLIKKRHDAGTYSILWDSRNYNGEKVATGTYFYQLKLNNIVQIKKLLLIK